jgi:hypothetical protein
VLSRRTLLLSAVSTVTGLAGCTSSKVPVSTDSETVPRPELAYSASVIAPQTESHPLTVELSVTNSGDGAVFLSQQDGNPLQDLPAFDGSQTQLKLFPVQSPPDQLSQDGSTEQLCWRVSSEEAEQSPALGQRPPVEIHSKKTHAVRHYVYQVGRNSPCFPVGSYQASVDLTAGNPRWNEVTPTLTYTLDISAGGAKMSVTDT